MPTTKMPVWIRSEYVTIGQPPFRKIRGQEAAPHQKGQPPTEYWQRRRYDIIVGDRKQQKLTDRQIARGTLWTGTGIEHPLLGRVVL